MTNYSAVTASGNTYNYPSGTTPQWRWGSYDHSSFSQHLSNTPEAGSTTGTGGCS